MNKKQDILAPISLGELIDKITILQIKTNHLEGQALHNVKNELNSLELILNNLDISIEPTLISNLKKINAELWSIEDQIRIMSDKKFDEKFVFSTLCISTK